EMVFAHYNPHEHNFEVLRNRTLAIDSRIKTAFPCDTEEQKALFDQLSFAYSEARYNSEEEFVATKEQLTYWSNEAKKLLELTETICQERIEGLKAIEAKAHKG